MSTFFNYTVADILNSAGRIINIIDESQVLSAEQSATALTLLNDMLAEWIADGLDIGWFTQTNVSSQAPIQPEDVRAVKYCLAGEMAAFYDIASSLSTETAKHIENAYAKISKRYVKYFESDLSGLPVPEGIYFGGGRA